MSARLAGVPEKWAHSNGAAVQAREAVLYSQANYCRQELTVTGHSQPHSRSAGRNAAAFGTEKFNPVPV